MNRVIKFRVWDKEKNRYLPDGHAYLTMQPDRARLFVTYSDGKPLPAWVEANTLDRFVLEYSSGLRDREGRDIYEGDIIIASEARYEMTQLAAEYGESDSVYFADHDKPLPSPDVPFFKAAVEWNQSMCGWWLRYVEKRSDWGPGASTPLNDKHYLYEVIGNVRENPELLNK
jgi:uncharacterized phage protein (TIGR01671 family)